MMGTRAGLPVGDRRVSYRVLVGYLKERGHLEDLGIDGILLKWDLQEVEWEGVSWIDLAQDRDRRHAIVNVIMNCRVM